MKCRVLLLCGSLRASSTNAAVLRTAMHVAPAGVETVLYDGLARLPHFNPDADTDPLDSRVAELREAIHAADAVVICTPEYAGALPGSFKNLLDWTIGDDKAGSIYEKPVAWINTSPRGAQGAHDELRAVLTYAHAQVIDDACAVVAVTSAAIGSDGLIADPSARAQIAHTLETIAAHRDQAATAQSAYSTN